MNRMETQPTSSFVSAPPDSPKSFHSTRTINSSPSRSNARAPELVYRQVRKLPYELREVCRIYFEEGLFCQALSLLTTLLTSGTNSSLPAILPPPQHIALIATLAVHPTLTTRAKTLDRIQAANLALEYLRLVLYHVGPLQGSLGYAFEFSHQSAPSRRSEGRRKKGNNSENQSPTDTDTEGIEGELANAGSLWAQTENFWQVVGWSFNCSVLHKRRWERWRAWLTYMLDMLEADWEVRERMTDDNALETSLIVRYMDSRRAIAGRERRIVRGIFADGRTKSNAEFGEIWKNETKELKKDTDVRKIETKIDIEADNFGDYMDDENQADLEDSTSEYVTPASDTNDDQTDLFPDVSGFLGGMDSIHLRVRLLALLSKVAYYVPESFTDINTLYDIYVEHIRVLPIPAFFLLISPPTLSHFAPEAANALTQYILRSMIAASAPSPEKDDLSQDTLETYYLPFAANTNSIVDNTKVSLCVEALLRLLVIHTELGLAWTPYLHEAAETGIKARFDKAKKKQTRRGTDGDRGCDGTWLEASAERIRAVIAMAGRNDLGP